MMNKLSYEDVCSRIDSILKEKKDDVLNVPMLHSFYITDNEKYDPENFSQEIEDTETKEPVTVNGHINANRNSDAWSDNHSKICPVKVALGRMIVLEHIGEGKWRRPSGYADTMKEFFRKKMETENVYQIEI